jgi:hypothetical protein
MTCEKIKCSIEPLPRGLLYALHHRNTSKETLWPLFAMQTVIFNAFRFLATLFCSHVFLLHACSHVYIQSVSSHARSHAHTAHADGLRLLAGGLLCRRDSLGLRACVQGGSRHVTLEVCGDVCHVSCLTCATFLCIVYVIACASFPAMLVSSTCHVSWGCLIQS